VASGGLLRPNRSSAGYRIYSERDLETLEEIDAEREARDQTDAEEALAQTRERARSFVDSGVLEFIKRARAARG
jgi:DNA-binding transcriptional MerR regulator